MTGLIDEVELLAELQAMAGETIGWLPLAEGAYLHLGHPEAEEVLITVTGVPEAAMANLNVLLLT